MTATSDELAAFLQATDLDDALAARQRLGSPGAEDVASVRAIVEQWRPPQAIANLLFHPSVMPADLAVPALLRGLGDRDNLYNALAATVGLQDVDPTELTDEQRAEVRGRLFELIDRYATPLASRASVSILPFLVDDDVPGLFGRLAHPNPTARHNLLGWLYERLAPTSGQQFLATAAAHGAPADALARVRDALRADEERVAAGKRSLLTLPLYDYIPDLAAMETLHRSGTAAADPGGAGPAGATSNGADRPDP